MPPGHEKYVARVHAHPTQRRGRQSGVEKPKIARRQVDRTKSEHSPHDFHPLLCARRTSQ